MSQEKDDDTTATTNETEAKPTITIAEKEEAAAAGETKAKPTITIAEKDRSDNA